jgi:FkbM family methyltransferase
MQKLAGNIFLYGSGTFACDILNILVQHQINVSGFLDHYPRQVIIQELQIQPPDAIPVDVRSASTVIIGIHNRDANVAAIISRLKSLGFNQIVTPIDLYDEFADELGPRFWLTKRTFYNNHTEELNSAANLFSDEVSRDLFNRLFQFRLTGDYSILPQPDIEHQYFPPDIPSWKTPLRFVDCGAFDGDTLRNFIGAHIPIEAVAAFEPDQNNFQKLVQFISDNQKSLPNTILLPCGVFSSTTQLKFATSQGEASKIISNGDGILQCVSLDDAIPNFAPNLIKMDIEGAEIEAIHGAQNIIQRYKPGLAISVYHAPSHIWEIPVLIHQMMPSTYSYHLRSHGFNDFDMVLYALPI